MPTQKNARAILGDFAINHNGNYSFVLRVNGTPSGLYTVKVSNLYQIQKWNIYNSINEVDGITTLEEAVLYLKGMFAQPDFSIPEDFNTLDSEEERQYCLLLCYDFALSKIFGY